MDTEKKLTHPSMPVRDGFLDFLRGCAIILVALGHYIQTVFAGSFDDLLWFRLIYCFHMALFIFVSGWAASIGMKKQHEAFGDNLVISCSKALWTLPARALRLLWPFFTWGILLYFTRSNYASQALLDYVKLLITNPDNGLWFLPTLFFCYFYLVIAWVVFLCLRHFAKGAKQLLLVVFAVGLSYKLLISSTPLFAIAFTKQFYPYFIAGLAWGWFKLERLPRIPHELIYILFLLLFPLWHRTISSPVFEQIWAPTHLPHPELVLATLVGAAGTYIFVQMTSKVYQGAGHYIRTTMSYIGFRTLEIYAVHIFFLTYFTGILGIAFAIFASLGVSLIIRNSAVLSFVLLGDYRRIR